MATSTLPYVLGAVGLAAVAYIFLSPTQASAAEITASAKTKGDADGCAAGTEAGKAKGERSPVAGDAVLSAAADSGDSKAYLDAWAAAYVRCFDANVPVVTKDVVPVPAKPPAPKPPAKPTTPTPMTKLLDRVTANNDWVAGCKLGAKYGWKAACEKDGDYAAPTTASAAKKAGYYYSYSAGKKAYVAGMPCDFSTDSVFSCADSASETAFSAWYESHKVVSAGVETGTLSGWGHDVNAHAKLMDEWMKKHGTMAGFHDAMASGAKTGGVELGGRVLVGMRRAPVELAAGGCRSCGGAAQTTADSTIYRSY